MKASDKKNQIARISSLLADTAGIIANVTTRNGYYCVDGPQGTCYEAGLTLNEAYLYMKGMELGYLIG